MTPKLCLNVFAVIILLKTSSCYAQANNNVLVTQILNTLNSISANNDQLKDLLTTFIKNISTRVSGCQCVPFYLCHENNIITNGKGVLIPRGHFNPCAETEVCCEDILYPTTPKPEKKISIEDCGYPSDIKVNLSSPLDSTTSKFGEFPWTIVILFRQIEYACVGSLIHPQVVLTAAHCIQNRTEFTVRAGEWNITDKSEPYPYQDVKVKKIVIHPKFNRESLYYNVALLVLDTPVKLDLNVRTVCLADEFVFRTSYPNSACTATGWGVDRSLGAHTRVMKKINYSLMSHTMCQLTFQKSRLGRKFELHNTFLCGINEQNQDLCNGDGGGPFVCPLQNQPLRFQQVGITSWALSCNSDFPSVFTDISNVKNWIDAQFLTMQFNTKYYTP
ncbi:hypothetical protein FQR65_LT08224 [Abscondita terminalis]|nr:hypothetical protein FQR65_LT08224 [Abscondita terminalis]